jgi:hypothetical protein
MTKPPKPVRRLLLDRRYHIYSPSRTCGRDVGDFECRLLAVGCRNFSLTSVVAAGPAVGSDHDRRAADRAATHHRGSEDWVAFWWHEAEDHEAGNVRSESWGASPIAWPSAVSVSVGPVEPRTLGAYR